MMLFIGSLQQAYRNGPTTRVAAFTLAALLAVRASAAPALPSFDFENGLLPWVSTDRDAPAAAASAADLGRASNVARFHLAGRTSAGLRLKRGLDDLLDLSRSEAMRFWAFVPAGNAYMHLAVALVDRDEQWYQTSERIRVPGGKWTAVTVDLRPGRGAFGAVGHARPWGEYVAREVREVGITLFSDRPVTGPFCVDDVAFLPAPEEKTAQAIYNYEISSPRVERYGRFEITFELSRVYDNPFDPGQIAVWADFTAPSGATARVPGFFYQDYERRIDRKIERLTPVGSPKWKVRFAPTEIGRYTFSIEINDGEALRIPARDFECVSSDRKGFLRVCKKDKRYFEFDNGDFFYPIGHNIPATFNEKAAQALGLTPEKHEGTFAYDRFLDGMARGRENFARMWLASWSLGLEWSPRYHPTYRGLGRYSLENAWRLDYILDRAERQGLYVQLALTTFGHFRAETFEGDWPHSPYNRANGGLIDKPQEFWTNAQCQDLYQRMVRYVMARWGYSDHLAAWELSNEIDLVDGYKNLLPQIIEWHKRCAVTIGEFDPNRRLVTTNFANAGHQPEILRLPEISYSSTNHYNTQIVKRMRDTIYPNKAQFGKPAIMAECGYDFKGAMPETTIRYLHLCLWGSYMIPFAGAGMSWWWDFIDDRDLYPMFVPLAKFAEGEDRRGEDLDMAEGNVSTSDGLLDALDVDALQNKRKGYFWIYEKGLFRAEADAEFTPEPRRDLTLALTGFEDGAYTVEFWDTRKGEIIQTVPLAVQGGALKCALPTFTSDIAGKVKPAGGQ